MLRGCITGTASALTVAIVGSLALCGCMDGSAVRRSPSVHGVPGASVGSGCRITGFDAVLEGDTLLHVIWTTRQDIASRSGLPGAKFILWYQRGHLATETWGPEVPVCQDESAPARLVPWGDELHVIVGGRLRDFGCREGGARWEEGTPWLDVSPKLHRFARAFDVLASDSVLAIAYVRDRLAPATPYEAVAPDSLEVWLARRTHHESVRAECIGKLPGLASSVTRPTIRALADGYQVAIGIRALRESSYVDAEGAQSKLVRGIGQVALFTSGKMGSKWRRPAFLPNPPNGARWWLAVDQVEWARGATEPRLSFDSRGGLWTVNVAEREFSRPAWIQSASVQVMDEEHSLAFGATLVERRSVLAWIAPPVDPNTERLWALVHRRPSMLRLGECQFVGDQCDVRQPEWFLRTTNEVTAVRVMRFGEKALVFWSEATGWPLFLGGARRGGRVRWAVVD
jgi:hypothetical protein